MSPEVKILIGAVAYIVVSHVFFLWQIQKLLNKLMSRSYYDYQVSKATPEEAMPEAPKYGELRVPAADPMEGLSGIL